MGMLLQAGVPWHREGLFLGMHWAWWLFWIATLAILAWAFWRLRVERNEARREAERAVGAGETRDRGGA